MTEFHVPEMNCGACAHRIEQALAQAALPEHTQVEIDVARKTVRVPEVSAQTLQAVQAAIEAAGSVRSCPGPPLRLKDLGAAAAPRARPQRALPAAEVASPAAVRKREALNKG